MLDRAKHHPGFVQMTGESYRRKKRKSARQTNAEQNQVAASAKGIRIALTIPPAAGPI
jgi:hypothetical protein